MTVVLRHSDSIDLNLIEYRDAVSFDQLKAVACYVSGNPEHMKRDALNLVLPGAHFNTVEMAELDALFAHYRDLYAPLHFAMLRRSAWICQSEAAAPHVNHWLGGDVRTGMSSTIQLFASIAEACEWLVLTEAESAAVQRGDGFAELIRFNDAAIELPAAIRAAVR